MVTHLETAFTEELVARAERDLDHASNLGHLAGSIVLDVRNTLEIRCQLLDDDFPRGKALDEQVCGIEIRHFNIFLDERAGAGRAMSAHAGD